MRRKPKPKHSLAAFVDAASETSVLGSIILNNEALDAVVAAGLKARDFYSSANRTIFTACQKITGAGVVADLVTVSDELERAGTLAAAGGLEYVSTIADGAFAVSNVLSYAGIVKAKSKARILYLAAHEACQLASDGDVDAACERMAKGIESVLTGISTAGDWLKNIIAAGYGLDKHQGQPWGYPVLDDYTGGIPRGGLTIIGAYPSTGKTALATNVLAKAAKRGTPVALFSQEMNRGQIVQTILSRESGIPAFVLREHGYAGLRDADKDAVAAALPTMDFPLWLEDADASSVEIAARARMLQRVHGVEMIAVDYLTLLKPNVENAGDDTRRRIDGHIGTLKSLAKATGLSVILMSQLAKPQAGREGHDANPKPSSHALKESGAIFEAADMVVMLWRPRFRQREECGECCNRPEARRSCPSCSGRGFADTDNEMVVCVEKHRFGEAGRSLSLGWCGMRMELSDWREGMYERARG